MAAESTGPTRRPSRWWGTGPAGWGWDSTDLATLSTLRAAGVPLVVVLVSGRPLDIAAQLPNWDALVEAWLPGTEGQGVADVLFGGYNLTGKLPDTWMQSASQQPINAGDGKPALFALGAGSGFPATQNPYNVIGAAYYDGQSGTLLERCSDAGCGQNVGWIASGPAHRQRAGEQHRRLAELGLPDGDAVGAGHRGAPPVPGVQRPNRVGLRQCQLDAVLPLN
jgi:Glycosyl hydrolase family 3 C-terminal domain